MSLTAPREYRPSRAHTLIATTSSIGGLLLIWYVPQLLTPKVIAISGVILVATAIATGILMRRQRHILKRLDAVDRQFAHVRMRYVAEEIDDRFTGA